MFDLQITNLLLIFGVLLFILIIIIMIKKHKLSVKYAIIWLLAGFVLLVFAMFPYVVKLIRYFVGIELVSNLVFMMLISFLILVVLGLSSTVSIFSVQIKKLTQNQAMLEKRIRELEVTGKK